MFKIGDKVRDKQNPNDTGTVIGFDADNHVTIVWDKSQAIGYWPASEFELIEPDLSFTAHDDATSDGCVMCGNEWKSLNKQGYCSNCWTVWNS